MFSEDFTELVTFRGKAEISDEYLDAVRYAVSFVSHLLAMVKKFSGILNLGGNRYFR